MVQTSSTRSARVIHAALVAGILSILVVVHLVPSPHLQVGDALLYGPLGVGAAAFGAAAVLAGRLPPGDDAAAWWRAQFPRVLMVWGLLEFPALLGSVGFLLTHRSLPLVLPAVALVLLFIFSPGRLRRG